MTKQLLQKMKAYLDQLESTGNIDDYHAAVGWFWTTFPPPGNRPKAHDKVFDRFAFQAFERLGLNPPPYPKPINPIERGFGVVV